MNGILAPFGPIGRLRFLWLTALLLAASFGCFYAGMTLSYDMHVPPGIGLVWLSVALLLGGGAVLAASRLRDIGAWASAGLATMLPRIGWMYGLTQIQIFISNNWFEVTLALLALDAFVLLVLSLWPPTLSPRALSSRAFWSRAFWSRRGIAHADAPAASPTPDGQK